MSTKQADATLDFLSERPGSVIGSLFAPIRKVFNALAEGKAAADQYESLVARGMGLGEASQVVFRTHFGKQ